MEKEDLRNTRNMKAEDRYSRYQMDDYRYADNWEETYLSRNPQRSLREYFMMVRERIWFLIIAVFIFVSVAVLYTVTTTKTYTAVAKMQLLRDDPSPLQTKIELEPNTIRGIEDFNTQINVLNSIKIVKRVSDRLKADELEEFLAPYKDNARADKEINPVDILFSNRSISPQRMSLMFNVSFEHPNPIIAARITNLFAEELIDYNQMLNVDSSLKAVRELKERVEQQEDRVSELELQIAEYREQNDAISLNEDENTMRADLLQLRGIKLQEKNKYDNYSVSWEQIEKYRKEGKNLWKLRFIAEERRVVSLLDHISEIKINIASLSKRYREKHPIMIAQLKALEESEAELEAAVNDAAEKIYAAYMEAKGNFELAEQSLEETEAELFKLSKTRIEYNSLLRVMEVEQQFLRALTARMTEESAQVNFKKTNVRLIDEAFPPVRPSSPNAVMNVVAGLFGGVAIGTGLIFMTIFFDDRVKSTFDVEESLGLPLIGLTPRIGKLDDNDKAQMVATNSDRSITEVFRSIYSTLKLEEESKDAKIMLVTSTVPEEGKSFVSSNLAITFASHGEKTLLLDGDLRLPSVARFLKLEVDKGILSVIEGSADLDEVIVKEMYPNLDILPSGGVSNNPTKILNSSEFKEMVTELRKRYDRIVIDSPPVAAVSDALNMLSLADGILYVIKFNNVDKSVIKKNLRSIKSSKKPLFGAILNKVGKRAFYAHTGYRYTDYHVG